MNVPNSYTESNGNSDSNFFLLQDRIIHEKSKEQSFSNYNTKIEKVTFVKSEYYTFFISQFNELNQILQPNLYKMYLNRVYEEFHKRNKTVGIDNSFLIGNIDLCLSKSIDDQLIISHKINNNLYKNLTIDHIEGFTLFSIVNLSTQNSELYYDLTFENNIKNIFSASSKII